MPFDPMKALNPKVLTQKSLAFQQEFKKFLFQGNALSLAIGVVIGGAFNGFVKKISTDLIMPVINLLLPNGAWQKAGIQIGKVAKLDPHTFKPIIDPKTHQVVMVPVELLLGELGDAFLTLIITGLICFLVIKIMVKPPPPVITPPTKSCAFCLDTIPAAATRCKSCCSDQPGEQPAV